MNCISSESDIWSEPDRNISMQRIGISLQNSPVMSKSPRKQKLKDKRLSSRLSPDKDTSSSDSQHLFKKRYGRSQNYVFMCFAFFLAYVLDACFPLLASLTASSF